MAAQTGTDLLDCLKAKVEPFRAELLALKERLGPPRGRDWYHYSTLGNVHQIDNLLAPTGRRLSDLTGDLPIADIGAADGDFSFLLERCSVTRVHAIDHEPTNQNFLYGARAVRDALESRVAIYDIDLDGTFMLPVRRYGLVCFLGVLYHLENPLNALARLSRGARYMILSTKVMRYLPDGSDVSHSPLAYLVDTLELNNDVTNWWIMTNPCLLRMLDRTGWRVLHSMTYGDPSQSRPDRTENDERTYVLAESIH